MVPLADAFRGVPFFDLAGEGSPSFLLAVSSAMYNDESTVKKSSSSVGASNMTSS